MRSFACVKESSTILTITGSDGTGLSGVQADMKTISALGGYAVSAITCITVQNTLGIQEFYDLPAAVVRSQIEAVVNDIEPQVIKVGLIRSVETLDVIIDAILRYRPRFVVYAPASVSAKGDRLMGEDVLTQIQRRLIPLCTLVAPQQHTLHGAQNTYCSAVAVYLSQNFSIEEAQERAARFAKGMMARTAEPQGRSMELYQAFVSAVEQHAKTNSDVAFYADCLNVSPRYLSQVCRKLGEKTPKQIIDTTLLACIHQELMLTTHTFQEIAYGCGFSSQAHFSKFFKKLTGMTPSDFRRQNKE